MTAQHSAAPSRSELAELIGGLIGAAPTIRAQHKPNRHGDCEVCTLPQGGPVKYPCTLATAADRRLSKSPSA
jgi:hypothetical protein